MNRRKKKPIDVTTLAIIQSDLSYGDKRLFEVTLSQIRALPEKK
jgi:hypothetical protein